MSENPVFYWDIMSQPSRAIKVLLDIGQIPCKYVHIDLSKRSTRNPEYLRLNPFGKIPLLIHGEFKLSESDAIMKYLYEKYSKIPRTYYGTTPEERGYVNQYLSWYQWQFRTKMVKYLFMALGVMFTGKPMYQNQVDIFLKEMHEVMLELN